MVVGCIETVFRCRFVLAGFFCVLRQIRRRYVVLRHNQAERACPFYFAGFGVHPGGFYLLAVLLEGKHDANIRQSFLRIQSGRIVIYPSARISFCFAQPQDGCRLRPGCLQLLDGKCTLKTVERNEIHALRFIGDARGLQHLIYPIPAILVIKIPCLVMRGIQKNSCADDGG